VQLELPARDRIIAGRRIPRQGKQLREVASDRAEDAARLLPNHPAVESLNQGRRMRMRQPAINRLERRALVVE